MKKINLPIIVAYTTNAILNGLIGTTSLNYGLLLINTNSIHTYFMKYSIDIVVLNKQNKVLDIKRNLKPFSIYRTNFNQNKTNILELPKNASLNIYINDYLSFKCKDII